VAEEGGAESGVAQPVNAATNVAANSAANTAANAAGNVVNVANATGVQQQNVAGNARQNAGPQPPPVQANRS
jgi:hypothetical protein